MCNLENSQKKNIIKEYMKLLMEKEKLEELNQKPRINNARINSGLFSGGLFSNN